MGALGCAMRFATQVGVDTDSWGLNIRGGNETEIVYMVDGVSMKDSRDNRPYSSFSKDCASRGSDSEGRVQCRVRRCAKRCDQRGQTARPRALGRRLATCGGVPAANKYFGPTMYSTDNWWDVGRFPEHDGKLPIEMGDGNPDFAGWNQIFADKGGPAGEWKSRSRLKDVISTPQQAKGIWDFQHRKVGGIATEASGIGPFAQDEGLSVSAELRTPQDRDADYTYDVTVGGPLVQGQGVVLAFHAPGKIGLYVGRWAVPNYRDDTWQAQGDLYAHSHDQAVLWAS